MCDTASCPDSSRVWEKVCARGAQSASERHFVPQGHANDADEAKSKVRSGCSTCFKARIVLAAANHPATVSGIEQALRERDQLTLAPVGTPRHAAVRQDAHDHATGGAAECLHAIAWFEIGGSA